MRFMSVVLSLLTSLGAVSLVAWAGAPTQAEQTLQVSTRARSFGQGEVVLVTVTASRSIESLTGSAFGHAIGFWSMRDARTWQGLVGIPLETGAGSYAITLTATAEGLSATSRARLQVVRTPFATRRLRVDPRYVNPPATEAERIAREARMLSELFARVRPGRLWNAAFSRPVAGQATSTFGRLTILNGTSRARHQGTDFRADEGTPIHAPNDGEVVLADDLYFSGHTVVLDHGEGLYSLFAHLSRVSVGLGSRVSRGELLGESGATGRVTGPHVHWAVRLQGVSVDPLSLVAALDPP